MSIEKIDELFVHLARDVYNAEKQLTKALPKLARTAANDELREGFEQHLQETEQHVERLEQIFEMLGQNPKGMKCAAAEGLVEEAQEIMGEIEDEQDRDAGLIAAAQAFEHYEISRYGTLVAWAQKMGQREIVRLLQQTLARGAQRQQPAEPARRADHQRRGHGGRRERGRRGRGALRQRPPPPADERTRRSEPRPGPGMSSNT